MNNNKKITLREINSTIRDFVNNSTIKKTDIYSKKHSGYWNQFFVALDTIDDTCTAIENFQNNSIDCFIAHSYVETYGILQALFIQQDAVNFLKVSLFGERSKIIWHKSYPELNNIRQIRNETIGHPIKKEQKTGKSKYIKDEITSCTIDRSSLSKTGFSYMLWMHSKTEKKSVNFTDTIDSQNKNLTRELEVIFKELQKEEEKHKSKFKNENLADLLSGKSLYQINLIYGVSWNDHLAWPSFDYYLNQYKKIRDGLEKHYGKFGTSLAIPGTAEVIKKLDYIFSKIEVFKSADPLNQQEFEIYVDALDAELEELKKHLQEIDREFKS